MIVALVCLRTGLKAQDKTAWPSAACPPVETWACGEAHLRSLDLADGYPPASGPRGTWPSTAREVARSSGQWDWRARPECGTPGESDAVTW